MQYYYRTFEAGTPEDAELLALKDFYAFGQYEEVISVKEIPVAKAEKQLDAAQETLVLRARYDGSLHRDIENKDRDSVRRWIGKHEKDTDLSDFADYQDIISHLDMKEMAEVLADDDKLPVVSFYGD